MKKTIENIQTVSGSYFDTINTISAWGDEQILKAALSECEKYNNLLSKTIPCSDVWKINHAKGQAVAVDPHTMKILKTAQEISEASGGAFNISVGSITALWHFTDGSAAFPESNKLTEAINRTDYTKIILGKNTVRIPADMQIDLGGIAKGYIADQVGDYLRNQGVKNALLNFGGNIVTVGSRLDGEPWTIGLQNPLGERGKTFWAALKSVDSTIVTSGIYERGFMLNGKWYHHILDPHTGWPVDNNLLTITVCARDSMLADALTTAMFVLGPQKGMRLAEKFDVHAVFLEKNSHVLYTKGLDIVFIR